MGYGSNNANAMFDKRQFFAAKNKIASDFAVEKNIASEKSENAVCEPVAVLDSADFGNLSDPIAVPDFSPASFSDSPASPSPSPAALPVTSPARPRRPRDPFPESVLAAAIPCPACQCSVFWESIYFDGVLRCLKCDPLPGLPSFTFWGRKVVRHTSIDTTDPGAGELVEWEQRLIDGKGPAELARERAERIRARGANDPTLPALGDGVYGGMGADDSEGDAGGQDDGQDNYDRFVEFRMVDGRRGWALRGWDNPRSPNFNLRLVQAAGIGWENADRLLDDAQEWLRVEMFGESRD